MIAHIYVFATGRQIVYRIENQRSPVEVIVRYPRARFLVYSVPTKGLWRLYDVTTLTRAMVQHGYRTARMPRVKDVPTFPCEDAAIAAAMLLL